MGCQLESRTVAVLIDVCFASLFHRCGPYVGSPHEAPHCFAIRLPEVVHVEVLADNRIRRSAGSHAATPEACAASVHHRAAYAGGQFCPASTPAEAAHRHGPLQARPSGRDIIAVPKASHASQRALHLFSCDALLKARGMSGLCCLRCM